jgi:hypothetical protein
MSKNPHSGFKSEIPTYSVFSLVQICVRSFGSDILMESGCYLQKIKSTLKYVEHYAIFLHKKYTTYKRVKLLISPSRVIDLPKIFGEENGKTRTNSMGN